MLSHHPQLFRPHLSAQRWLSLVCTIAVSALLGCQPRAADEPARSPPAEPATPSILEKTTIPPGEPEHRAPTAPPPPAQRAEGMRELFPGVRADIEQRVVEFDGVVPIDVHDPQTPRVYLEVTVCAPDTKEHEALVMTRARASHIHAALLAIRLEPGKPGGWSWEGETITPFAPEGDAVEVMFSSIDEDGVSREVDPISWIVNAETGAPFAEDGAGNGFVFAGSVMRERLGRDVYDADGVGTIVGLTTFGAETIAWREVISPDSQVQEPEWIADPKRTPPMGTRVTVRIRPAKRELPPADPS